MLLAISRKADGTGGTSETPLQLFSPHGVRTQLFAIWRASRCGSWARTRAHTHSLTRRRKRVLLQKHLPVVSFLALLLDLMMPFVCRRACGGLISNLSFTLFFSFFSLLSFPSLFSFSPSLLSPVALSPPTLSFRTPFAHAQRGPTHARAS